MTEKIKVPRPTQQAFHRQLASYAKAPEGVNYYHLFQCVQILRAVTGDKYIKENNYNDKINKIGEMVARVSSYYTLISRDKTIDENHHVFHAYSEQLAELNSESYELHEYFSMLLSETELEGLSIPAEYLSDANKQFNKAKGFTEGKDENQND